MLKNRLKENLFYTEKTSYWSTSSFMVYGTSESHHKLIVQFVIDCSNYKNASFFVAIEQIFSKC